MTTSPWEGDWKSRLSSQIMEFGFDSIADWLGAHPTEPYSVVAKRLDRIAGVQIIRIFMKESLDRGLIREAAKDALVRELHRNLTDGWQNIYRDFDHALVFTKFVSHLCESGLSRDRITELVKNVRSALYDISPPSGWLPNSTEDDYISTAFDMAWPENVKLDR